MFDNILFDVAGLGVIVLIPDLDNEAVAGLLGSWIFHAGIVWNLIGYIHVQQERCIDVQVFVKEDQIRVSVFDVPVQLIGKVREPVQFILPAGFPDEYAENVDLR